MADYILDKGFQVLSTYNSSAAGGVTRYRAVKLAVSSSTTFIDLNVAATTMSIGVVQEDIDQVKVATGKAVAGVRLLGVSWCYVQTGTSIVIGSRVTVGNAGGLVIAASTNQQLGIVIGMSVPGGTVAAGDLVSVLLTPGAVAP